MAYKKTASMASTGIITLGGLTPKQKQFTWSRSLYTAYGGARGGGKSHVVRWKAIAGATHIPGLRVLILRYEYPELEQTMILPMKQMIPATAATYNGGMRMFFFPNDSVIKFGHFGASESDEYQGQEWDWIFLDEATQFTEEEFLILGACLRGVTDVPRRMYLTCNPGGIGHYWVKRLFVDRDYQPDEHPEDYTFIQATVDDNPYLLKGSPQYVKQLDRLPEDVRRAWRYGDWDALAGTFFPEFTRATHEEAIPVIPKGWTKYRVLDYGLDMLACLWIAVDYQGFAHVYREVQQPGLIVSKAANLILSMTPPEEEITANIGPPDLWSTQKDTGRTMAEIFAESGLPLQKASRERVQGWMAVKEWLRPRREPVDQEGRPALPRLMVSRDCPVLFRNLASIQHDKDNPSDCATKPHAITHICDALRYWCASRSLTPDPPKEGEEPDPLLDGAGPESYDEFMTGGEAPTDYIAY